MQLYQVKGNTWIIEDLQLIPLYKTDKTHCILLDTGFYHQREALAAFLEASRLIPIGILGSHAHRDHSANHAWFQERFHIPVAMTLAEAGFSADPLMIQAMYQLSPAYIEKTPALRCLVCFPNRVIQPEEKRILFCGAAFGILPTPGHTPGHICIETPDQVLYLGDALLMGETLSTSKLPYYFAVEKALSSMELLRQTPCTCCIAAHKGIGSDLKSIAETNLSSMQGHIDRLLSALPPGRPLTIDECVRFVTQDLHLLTSNTEKAFLYRRLISKYLDYLVDSGALTVTAQMGMIYYTKSA